MCYSFQVGVCRICNACDLFKFFLQRINLHLHIVGCVLRYLLHMDYCMQSINQHYPRIHDSMLIYRVISFFTCSAWDLFYSHHKCQSKEKRREKVHFIKTKKRCEKVKKRSEPRLLHETYARFVQLRLTIPRGRVQVHV